MPAFTLEPESTFSLSLLLLLGTCSFALVRSIMPRLMPLAQKIGAIDIPGGRRMHAQVTPRIGGLGIMLGCAGTFAVVCTMAHVFGLPAALSLAMLPFPLLAGAGIAFGVGFWDDLVELPAWAKLMGQATATVPILFGTSLVENVAPFVGGTYVAVLVLMVWMMFFVNAFNLIDGLDGLSGGLALIAMLGLTIAGGLALPTLVVLIVLAGAVLAFLKSNWHPARIFMGDAGTHLIGFVLAVVVMEALVAAPSVPRLSGLLLLVGVPLLDATLTIVRRLARGAHPFAADLDHMHHRMYRRMQGSVRAAVGSLHRAAFLLALLGLLTLSMTMWWIPGLLAIFVAIGLVGYLGYLPNTSPDWTPTTAER